MPEKIRYTWGSSSLGDFVVAASDQGLVAFEFSDDRVGMIKALQKRFTVATIEPDIRGLLMTVRNLQLLVDNPDQETDIAIDPRGTAYEKQVWALLRTIKPGETASYGSLAEKLGTRDARDVTEAISANAIAILIPCHRVVKKDGSISGYRWGVRSASRLPALAEAIPNWVESATILADDDVDGRRHAMSLAQAAKKHGLEMCFCVFRREGNAA